MNRTRPFEVVRQLDTVPEQLRGPLSRLRLKLRPPSLLGTLRALAVRLTFDLGPGGLPRLPYQGLFQRMTAAAPWWV